MGASNESLTNIRTQQHIQKQYKLIKRFTCAAYGQITIIKNKQTQQLLALKYFLHQEQSVLTRVKKRASFKHPNLILLKNYWLEQDSLPAVSICSNLKKVGVLYEYYEKSLQDELIQQIRFKEESKKTKKDRQTREDQSSKKQKQKQKQTEHDQKGIYNGQQNTDAHDKCQTTYQPFSDIELTQMIWQLVDCLNYLQEKNIHYLISGLKNIKINKKRSVKLLQPEQSICYDQNFTSQLMHLISSKRQIPLHPCFQNQANMNNGSNFSNEFFIVQNIFVIGIIALSFALLKHPSDLGVFSKGAYNFDKLESRKEQILQKYPKTYFHLNQMLKMTFSKNVKYQNFIGNYHLTTFKQNQNSFSIKGFKVPVIPMVNLPLRQKIQKNQSRTKLSANINVNSSSLRMKNYFQM